MRKFIRGTVAILFFGCVLLWGLMIYYAHSMPEKYTVSAGKELVLNGMVNVREQEPQGRAQPAVSVAGQQYASTLRLWGVFPIKEVRVSVVDQPVVVVAGIPFGIKMYTDGVLVVGFSDVQTKAGPCNPAKIAGLRKGDVVVSVDGTAVTTNAQLRDLIEQSAGEYLELRVRRDDVEFTVRFRAVLSEVENRYRSGFWVRDSSAGVGTLTYFDPSTRTFGGLGHAVCDVDTGEILPISGGEIVSAEIMGVKKGTAGQTGSLEGAIYDERIGILDVNDETGVYGRLTTLPNVTLQTVPVAMKQQIQEGKARIYTTIEGTQPDWYNIEIKQIRYNDASPTKNMIVRITDERLLEKTGGIVQGMSGSPIIQDGKLVGAITHVLVNDPTRGYAIFAENMLETAQGVANRQVKEAG